MGTTRGTLREGGRGGRDDEEEEEEKEEADTDAPDQEVHQCFQRIHGNMNSITCMGTVVSKPLMESILEVCPRL